MSQEWLNGLAMISIEQRIRRSLNMEGIIKSFAEAKIRTVQFSWKNYVDFWICKTVDKRKTLAQGKTKTFDF